MKRDLKLGMGHWLALHWVCGLLACCAVGAQPAKQVPAPLPDGRRSGFLDMGPATQTLQADDRQNPAMLWVSQGQTLLAAQCQRCHAAGTLDRAAARYPAFDARSGQVLTLAGRIRECRTVHLQQPDWPAEHDEALALEAALAHAARGQRIAPPAAPAPGAAPLARAQAQGAALFALPMGQLGLSCRQCHEGHAGQRLAASVIPQGHPTGYPIYRLQWQGLGSLQRRVRGCMSGVRAEPFGYGSAELTALEAYLMQRAAGMVLEGPAVRP